MSTEIKNLGLIKAIHVGVNPPINIKMLWYNNTPNVNKHFYYDTVLLKWMPLTSAGIIDSGTVNLSTQSGNIIKNLSDGLFAKETITELVDFTLSGRDLTIQYKNETGTTTSKTVNIQSALSDISIKKISVEGNTLKIEQTDGSVFTVELNTLPDIKTKSTNSVSIVGLGTTNSPLRGHAIISPEAGNILSKKNNGLYASINFESLSVIGTKNKVITATINGQTKQASFEDIQLTRLEFVESSGDLNAYTNSVEPITTNLDGRYTKISDFEKHKTDVQDKLNTKVDKRDGYDLVHNETITEIENMFGEKIVSISITGEADKTLTVTKENGTTLEASWKDLFDPNSMPIADVRLNSLSFNVDNGVLTGRRSDNIDLSVNLDGRYVHIPMLNQTVNTINNTITQATEAIKNEVTEYINSFNINQLKNDVQNLLNNEIVRVYITGDETKTIHLERRDGTLLTHEYTDLVRGNAANGVKGLNFNNSNRTLTVQLFDDSELTAIIPGGEQSLNVNNENINLSSGKLNFINSTDNIVVPTVIKAGEDINVSHDINVDRLVDIHFNRVFLDNSYSGLGFTLKTVSAEVLNGRLTYANGIDYMYADTVHSQIIDAINQCYFKLESSDFSTSEQIVFGSSIIFKASDFDYNLTHGLSIKANSPVFNNFITEAPADGNQYVRQNNSWSQVNINNQADEEIQLKQPLASFNTEDLIDGKKQKGRNVILTNTAGAVNITINSNDGFVATYQKNITANVVFLPGAGKTLVKVDNTDTISGGQGGTATIAVIGNTILLRIATTEQGGGGANVDLTPYMQLGSGFNGTGAQLKTEITDLNAKLDNYINNLQLVNISNNLNTKDLISGHSQHGRHIFLDDGSLSVRISNESGNNFCATYQKINSENIRFYVDSNIQMILVDGVDTLTGDIGSVALVNVINNKCYLRIQNV